jgi:hypothetical protein
MPATVRGARTVFRKLASVDVDSIAGEVAKTLRTFGQRVAESAKANLAPYRDTGALADSIGIVVRRKKGRATTFVGPRDGPGFRLVDAGGRIVRRPIKYAHMLEFGADPHGAHPGQGATPFMRPAWDENVGAAQQGIGAALGRAAEHALREGG